MIDAKNYDVDERLGNGQSLQIRAIRADDKGALVEGFGQLSQESIYRRFFQIKQEISEEELHWSTEVDFVDHVALVAVVRENGHDCIVGGCRYLVVDDKANERLAEVAFTVVDAYQGQGIASICFKHLINIAHANGIDAFEAEVMADNKAMLRVFDKSGLAQQKTRASGGVRVVLSLADIR